MLELLLIFVIGMFLVYMSYKASTQICPPPRVEYRFIPRTLKEQIENPVKVSDIFNDLFNGQNLIVSGITGTTKLKTDQLNPGPVKN